MPSPPPEFLVLTSDSQPGSVKRPLRVAWFSYFPIEWLPDLPAELQGLPKEHPATWQRVLWEQFRTDPELELHILALRKWFPRHISFQRDNTTFHCVKTPGGLRAGSLYWVDTMLIRKALQRIQPDVVHAWGTEFGSAAVAGRLPYRSLVTMQGILRWLSQHFPLNRQMQISRFLEPGSLRRAQHVTGESSFAMAYLKEHYPHLNLFQIEHAPNPIFYSVRRTPPEGEVRLLAVGAFLPAKGADILIEALDGLIAQFPFKLVWVGSRNPALEQELRSRTSSGLWERITFTGQITAEQLAAEHQKATLLVYPTRADNSPNAVKEAVVAGLPVVASRIGGIPDYLKEGRNGCLFEAGNAAELRSALVTALQHPLFSRGAVEAGVLSEVRGYLSAETMAAKFKAAYQVVQAQR